MSKEIWLGPLLGTNRERLLARCTELVSEGRAEKLLYLAASHPLLDLVTGKLLDGTRMRGVWGELPVYLFRGFVRRVLSSAVDAKTGKPLAPQIAIDREELPLKRSLVSQILKRLDAAGKIRSLKPLVNRDGCIDTIASLIGEIQRAGKTPAEFQAAIKNRWADIESKVQSPKSKNLNLPFQVPALTPQASSSRSQIDFDREVALVYSTYSSALEHFGLTDEDADQLRAFQILRGQFDGRRLETPWLDRIELLVLDGFFDFTPVQGEMLRGLIPRVPNVIVNLNGDERNAEIFRPFQTTVDQLRAIAPFEMKVSTEEAPVSGALVSLRERLFNPDYRTACGSEHVMAGRGAGEPPAEMRALPRRPAVGPQDAGAPRASAQIRFLESSDRETEIREIAKEVKHLVFVENYKLSDIALIVRERAAYADTILRVFADESILCHSERRIAAAEVPAVRSCLKLFRILKELDRGAANHPKATDVADLVKSGYFRLSTGDLKDLAERFDRDCEHLLESESAPQPEVQQPKLWPSEAQDRAERLRFRLGVGRWDADNLENVIAFVGSKLRVDDWLDRAERLVERLPQADKTRALLFAGEPGDQSGEEDAESAQGSSKADFVSEKRRRPSIEIHPAAIAWASLIVERLDSLIRDVPKEGRSAELRAALVKLLETFHFQSQTKEPLRQKQAEGELFQTAIDLRGLESLRRSFAAAVRSFRVAEEIVPLRKSSSAIRLSTFLDEVERSLYSQMLTTNTADREGLRVLEATDVRGLRFRAVFIAGLVEGSFPLRTSGDWLYPPGERERLKRYGVTLEDISPETLLKEEHYFYQVACRVTDRLYLTRPLSVEDGNETVASYYIDQVRQAIAPFKIAPEQIRGGFDNRALFRSSTRLELASILVRQSEQRRRRAVSSPTVREGVDQAPSLRPDDFLPQPLIQKLLSLAEGEGCISQSAQRRIWIEREREGPAFGPFDGCVARPELLEILREQFGPESTHSASSLNFYGNCPFKFFANRVLRLEPRNEAALDLQAIDAGKLLHEVLRRFFEKHRSEWLPGLDREALRQELAEVADQAFDEQAHVVPPLNPRIWKIDREIRKIILDQVLLYELRLQEEAGQTGLSPAHFEVSFGRKQGDIDPISTEKCLEIKRPRPGAGKMPADRPQDAGAPTGAAERIRVEGRIDRVDVSEAGKVALAYDYKLSKGAALKDIRDGLEVQIPIYLAALEQLILPEYRLAGGGYYILRANKARRNQGLYRSAYSTYTKIGPTVKANLPDAEFERIRAEVIARVWEFIDGMRAGDFRVDPARGKKTCEWCDYSAVCRYEPYRINRKTGVVSPNHLT